MPRTFSTERKRKLEPEMLIWIMGLGACCGLILRGVSFSRSVTRNGTTTLSLSEIIFFANGKSQINGYYSIDGESSEVKAPSIFDQFSEVKQARRACKRHGNINNSQSPIMDFGPADKLGWSRRKLTIKKLSFIPINPKKMNASMAPAKDGGEAGGFITGSRDTRDRKTSLFSNKLRESSQHANMSLAVKSEADSE
jgi:hypothetical protein